jgi:hypothetical protein
VTGWFSSRTAHDASELVIKPWLLVIETLLMAYCCDVNAVVEYPRISAGMVHHLPL